MVFSTPFLFLLVLCIEDTQTRTGISQRNCRCVLARCIHLLPLYPLKVFILFLFIVSVTTFPQLLGPYLLSVSGKLFISSSCFPVCLCFSSASTVSLKPSGDIFRLFPLCFLVLWDRIFQFLQHHIFIFFRSDLVFHWLKMAFFWFSKLPS